MRPISVYSIQVDPYRNRRNSSRDPSPIKSTTHLVFQPEPGRTHSYLPYTNHPPDFKQSKTELYLESQTPSIASSQPTEPNPPRLPLPDYPYPKRPRHLNPSWILTGLFLLLITSGLILFLCWPRLPHIILKNEKAERVGDPADWGPNLQPWLRASWQLNMTLDNGANFVTTRLKEIELVLMDRDTGKPFGWSRTGPMKLVAHQQTVVPLIFRVDYESQSVNDTTFRNLYNACGPQMPSESPTLNVSMQATFHIVGIAWASVVHVHSPELAGLYCPFN